MPLKRKATALTLAAILAGFTILCADTSSRTSATWDEGGHIAAGYSYWSTGSFGVITYNLFLAQKLIASPLILDHDIGSRKPIDFSERDPTILGERLLYQSGGHPKEILRSTRAVVTFIGVLLGIGVYFQAAKLFGASGGLVSTILYASCPAIVSASSLATTDLISSALIFASVIAWWRLLHRASVWSVTLAGLSMGALFLTKYSFIAFMVVAFVLAAYRVFFPQVAMSRAHASRHEPIARVTEVRNILFFGFASLLVAWFTIWAFFGFRINPGNIAYNWDSVGQGTVLYRFTAILRRLHVFPEPYVFDLTGLRSLRAIHPSFVGGSYANGPQLKFFPLSFALKTPLPLLVGLLISMGSLWRLRKTLAPTGRTLAYECVPYVALILLYGGLAINSSVNIGHRHLLPVYVPLFVLAGAMAAGFGALRAVRRLAVVIVCAWSIGVEVAAHPDELAYFNPIAGGSRHGYAWFVDSSSDWGEQLPALRHWLMAPENKLLVRPHVYLVYFGTAAPAAYGIDAVQVTGFEESLGSKQLELGAGTFCVSPTLLQGGDRFVFGPWTAAYEREYQSLAKHEKDLGGEAKMPDADRFRYRALLASRLCSTLRGRVPDARVGVGFFVYNLSSEEVDRALKGPPAELYQGLPIKLPLKP